MFRTGKVLKVKVELSPDVVGFGRATIVDCDGSKIYLQLKTSKGEKRILPKGTRVWFVSDTSSNPFNGLWSTTIVAAKIIGGKTAMECSRPKFEALVQKRKQRRVSVSCPVKMEGELWKGISAVTTRNISRSGVGVEIFEDCSEQFQTGHHLDLVIESNQGEIAATARVIQARYNWLANRTDIGLEFVRMETEAAEILDRWLIYLGGRPRQAPEGKEKKSEREAGLLSGWLKSSKDNISFVKSKEHAVTSALSEEDLDELSSLDDEDDDDSESSQEA